MKHTDPDSVVATGALVKRNDFAEAATFAARLVDSRNTIPVLANLLLQETGGALTVRSTDLDAETSVTIDAAIAPGFAATVPAANVAKMLKHTKTCESVTIDLVDEKAVFGFGELRVSVATLPVEDFPTFDAGEFTHEFTIQADKLLDTLRRIAFAVSTEGHRYYLNGAYMHFTRKHGGKLNFVATDGHRLAKAEIKAPTGSQGIPGGIIPADTIKEVMALCKVKTLADSLVTIKMNATKILFQAGRHVIRSKLIDGTFPDYNRVIPAGNSKALVMSKNELVRVVQAVTVVQSERGRAVKLSMAADKLTASVSNPDIGNTTMTVACRYTDEPVDIGFNAQYLLEILDKIGGGDVHVYLSDPGSPTIFKDPDDKSVLFLLMPMRV